MTDPRSCVRRDRLTRLLPLSLRAALAAPALLLSACASSPETAAAGARPNVVLILADDLGWGELGAYGQSRIRTPHLDALAAAGMRFTQAYSGAPVCAPSRDVLLTGRHLGHATVRGNRPARNDEGKVVEGQHPIPAEVVTLAEVFRAEGYVTGAIGKWGLGPVGSSGDPNAQGFDRFFGYNCQRVAHSYYPPHLWSDREKIVINDPAVPGHKKQPEGEVRMEDWFGETYAPDLMMDEALRFLDEHHDEPFFLYLPFLQPHVAMHPPRELVESYPASWDDRAYRGQCAYLPHPRPRAGYAAMITEIDQHVGDVLARLDALGIADDTLVVFTSDNGTTHGSKQDEVFGIGGVDAAFFDSTAGLRGFKGSVYEGGLRVPLVARWPGHVASASASDQPTYFPDFYVTFHEVLGLAPPDSADGMSLLPALTGAGDRTERNAMVWVYPEYGGQVALREGDWKLVRRGLTRPDQEPGPWELYDLATDPGEHDDRAAEHPELVARLAQILREQTDENELFPVPIPPPGT